MGRGMAAGHQAETLSPHGAVCGTHGDLLLSSKPRDWKVLLAEVFRARDVDVPPRVWLTR
jgi:hypothetical protein